MVLVIGAGCFLGSALVKDLLKRYDKIKILLEPHEAINHVIEDSNRIIKAVCPLNDFNSICLIMQDVKYIYNLHSYNKTILNKREICSSIINTANIVNVAAFVNVEKVIHISSLAAIGGLKDGNKFGLADIYSYPCKNNLYGINQYEVNREVFRARCEGLNTVIVYAPLFKEDTYTINKLISYHILKINRKDYIVISFGKINSFIDKLIYLQLNNTEEYNFIAVEENILFKDLAINFNANIKTTGFFKNSLSLIASYLYSKNKVKLDSEISFWANNTNSYIGNNISRITSNLYT